MLKDGLKKGTFSFLTMLALTAAFTFTACDEKDEETVKEETEKAAEVSAVTQEECLTVGTLEYIGEGYPDAYKWSEEKETILNRLDKTPFLMHDAVISQERTDKYFASLEGYERKSNIPEEIKNKVVLEVSNVSESIPGLYQCIVNNTLYADTDLTGEMIYLNCEGIQPENEKSYMVYGIIDRESGDIAYVTPKEHENTTAGDITEKESLTEEGYAMFEKLAVTLKTAHNGMTIRPVTDLAAEGPFHKELLQVAEGRTFTQEEYGDNAKVCIINGLVAEALSIKPGDTISLKILKKLPESFYESFSAEEGYTYEDDFLVAGITNDCAAFSEYIYMPSSRTYDTPRQHFGYEALRVILDHDMAGRYVKDIQEFVPDDFRFTVYDPEHGICTVDGENLRGFITDERGNKNTDISMEDVEALCSEESIENVFFGVDVPCAYLGTAGALEETVPEPFYQKEDRTYGESLDYKEKFTNTQALCFTDDLHNTEEFRYVKEIPVQYMEGYDHTYLETPYQGELTGIIPESMMEENGIVYGDTIAVTVDKMILDQTDQSIHTLVIEVKVIGSYKGNRTTENIYCPLDAAVDTSSSGEEAGTDTVWTGYQSPAGENIGEDFKISYAGFTVSGSKNVDKVRSALEEKGFTDLYSKKTGRKYIVIENRVM